MNESDFNELKEKSWRRKLTPAEEAELRAWLAGHPEAGVDWEAEIRLTDAMGQLPDAPVPSNFTSRVLQEVQHESGADHRAHPSLWTWILRSWQPRIAVIAAVALAGLLTYQHRTVATRQKVAQEQQMARAQAAQDVKLVAGVRSLPSPEVLQDFDTIRKMGATPGPDAELIALLK